MRIVEIQPDEFNKFIDNFPYKNFYQTTEYGMLMGRHQFNEYYLGLMDETDTIVAATLILVRKEFIGYKWGYCPRGFLIDFKDEDLVKKFTTALKEYLIKRNFMFVKLDPILIYKSRNNKGEVTPEIDNEYIYNTLISLGYEHSGFNNNFENLQPRCNAITNLNDNDALFTKFTK
ncbi:MAG: peptidoglycan bridge formation glycyltransferase FemA/FemB family protein, partial [Bacilli bacterium]|nr:peptidoglycan bridge formation glycyltransferase FemA/FemB family protein [Bacilli bacterium]